MIIPVIIGAFGLVFGKLGVLFRRSREMVDRLNKIITESIIGAALVRVLNAQITEYNKFIEANATARNISLSILKLFATLIPIVVFVGNMASLAILAIGGHFVITGAMSLGDFAAFSSYLVITPLFSMQRGKATMASFTTRLLISNLFFVILASATVCFSTWAILICFTPS